MKSSKLIKNDQRGASLVELLVAISLLAVLSTAILGVFLAVYQNTTRSTERSGQLVRGAELSGALNALLAEARPSGLGLTTAGLPAISTPQGSVAATSAGLLPTSLAGDQLTFSSRDRCFRLFYRQNEGLVWLATASQCSSLAQAGTGLQRGPNQFPGVVFAPGSPLYDPVLDQVTGDSLVQNSQFSAYPLARGVTLSGPSPLLEYRFNDLALAPASASATLGTNSNFYLTGNSQKEKIVAIISNFSLLADPQLAAGAQETADKNYSQTIFINQICRSQ